VNKRIAGVLLFALVVSGAATLVLYRMLAARVAAQGPPAATHLLVAARDLPAGTLVKEGDLREVDWTGLVPAQAISKREDVLERGVVSPIYAGEPLLQTRLAPKGAGAGLAAIIPPGKRAVAIRVNDVSSVAGFVTAGMRVDILMLGNPPNSSSTMGTQTKTLLQNMEVLSAGQEMERDKTGRPVSVPVVNVLVTPEQAEILSLASQDARIQLVLRNPLDTEEAKTSGTALGRLWSGQTGPDPAPKKTLAKRTPVPVPVQEIKPEPAKPVTAVVVQILHGATKTEAKFVREDAEEK
jgi:pilus assembly protein CpaB